MGCPVDIETTVKVISQAAADLDIQPVAKAGDECEGVLVCPRADADGTITGVGLVNTRKEARSITLHNEGGKDLLSGDSCGSTIELEPLQVRLIRC